MPEIADNLPDFLTENEVRYVEKYREYKSTHKLKEPDSLYHKKLKTKVETVTQQQIDALREELIEYIEKNRSDLKLNERFIKEFLHDVYLRGFIACEHKNTIEKIVATIKYRTEFDHISDETFPKEFLEFGSNIATGFDLYGNPIFYLFVKRNYAPRKLFIHCQKYVAYLIYKLIRISLFTNGFLTFFIDFSNASAHNVDFNGLRLLITILGEHAPVCLNRIICHNIHWAIRPAFKIGYALLPSTVCDITHLTTSKDINILIESGQLSSVIEGGLNNEILLGKPTKNSPSFLEHCHKMNLTIDEARKLIGQYKKSLQKNNLELIGYE